VPVGIGGIIVLGYRQMNHLTRHGSGIGPGGKTVST
jgi:hypothetical protein